MTGTRVGTLGSEKRAVVDGHGRVVPEGAGWQLDWWIGAEDRRHVPAREASLRQRRPGVTPAVETALRVPSGDAVHRVYGVGGPADLVVVEVENDSPIPFAAALAVGGRDGRGPATTVADNWLLVDGERAVRLPRPPLRRDTDDGDAIVYPVAHRTRLRFAVALTPAAAHTVGEVASLPDLAEVARGWEAQLGRGLRVDVPDPGFQQAVDGARADLLLAPVDAAVATALEDWGFDAEFRRAWPHLSFRARRRARRRPIEAVGWEDVRAAQAQGAAPGFLLALRRLLVRETAEGVDLLTELPAEWVGQGIEVHDAPTRRGLVSYAVRWHGARPALLWQCEHPGSLRAPGLDPTWTTDQPAGEALLAPAPRFGVGNLQ